MQPLGELIDARSESHYVAWQWARHWRPGAIEKLKDCGQGPVSHRGPAFHIMTVMAFNDCKSLTVATELIEAAREPPSRAAHCYRLKLYNYNSRAGLRLSPKLQV